MACAYGLSYPYLVCPLIHGYQHDIRQSYRPNEECDHRQYEEENSEKLHNLYDAQCVVLGGHYGIVSFPRFLNEMTSIENPVDLNNGPIHSTNIRCPQKHRRNSVGAAEQIIARRCHWRQREGVGST